MYVENMMDSSKFTSYNPLQRLDILKGKCDEVAYFFYTESCSNKGLGDNSNVLPRMNSSDFRQGQSPKSLGAKTRSFPNLIYVIMKYLLYIIISIVSVASYAQGTKFQRSQWLIDKIYDLETKVESNKTEIELLQSEIQKCEITITKSENIISLAQQKGNTEAEKVARQANQKAKEAKQTNINSLISLSEYIKKQIKILDYLKTGANDAELKLEQFEFESNRDDWIKSKDELILQRLNKSNSTYNSIYKSLKSKAPPPLAGKSFDSLQAGDVLLIGKNTDFKLGNVVSSDLSISAKTISEGFGIAVNAGDNFLSSNNESKASHTLIYLKTINGQKMFLDNLPGKGPAIISEQEYIHIYGNRRADIAQLAQPLNNKQGEELYKHARQLAQEQLKMNVENTNKIFTGTKFGIKDEDMVCSEASRWVLHKVGAQIPDTDDIIKKKIGVKFSPADFTNTKYFIVTPLYGLPKTP